jgi:hypothetical protein
MGKSKAKRHRKLQLTRTLSESHPSDDPGSAAIDASVSWISRADVIEDIEGIHTELGCDVLTNGSVLRYGQIGIEEGWAKVIVTSNITEVIEVGPRKWSRAGSVWAKGSNWFEILTRMRGRVERGEMCWQTPTCFVGHPGTVRYVGSALAIARSVGQTARPVQRGV